MPLASHAALRLNLATLLAQSVAQVIGPHALRLYALGQERHDQRSQHGQQLTSIATQSGGLTQLGFSLLLLATKDIAQNGARIQLRATRCRASAQHRPQNAAQTA